MAFLSVPGLEALGWVFIGIGILLTAVRFTVRWMAAGLQGVRPGIRRFKPDDGFHLLGLCGAITYVALQTSGLAVFIRVEEYNDAHKGHVDLADEAVFFRIRLGAVLIFWVTMYSLKFAFLMLYRSIFWISVPFRRAWYAIATFTLLCFLANFLACFWVCGYPLAPTNLAQCLEKHTATQNTIEYVWMSLNTASSLLILLLPMFMLRSLKMAITTKISLAALFTLGALDIFFDIFRTWYTTKSVGVQNLWEIVEVTVAVMLSALVTFRQVLTLRRERASKNNSRARLNRNGSTFNTSGTKQSGNVTVTGNAERYEMDETDVPVSVPGSSHYGIPMTERSHV